MRIVVVSAAMYASLLAMALLTGPTLPVGYRVVGLTDDGRAVVHHVDPGAGVDRFELVAPGVAPVPCVALPASGTLPPTPGFVAPDGSAAVLVRGALDLVASFTVTVVDGEGDLPVVDLATPCFDGSPGTGEASATASWFVTAGAPSVVVITGQLPACSGVERAFVEVVSVRKPLTEPGRADLTARLRAEVETVGVAAKTPLAEALVQLDDSPASLVLLARTYAAEKSPGAAVSTLWRLARRAEPEAATALEAAIGSDWAGLLASRAAFRALVWTTVQARPPRPLTPEPP